MQSGFGAPERTPGGGVFIPEKNRGRTGPRASPLFIPGTVVSQLTPCPGCRFYSHPLRSRFPRVVTMNLLEKPHRRHNRTAGRRLPVPGAGLRPGYLTSLPWKEEVGPSPTLRISFNLERQLAPRCGEADDFGMSLGPRSHQPRGAGGDGVAATNLPCPAGGFVRFDFCRYTLAFFDGAAGHRPGPGENAAGHTVHVWAGARIGEERGGGEA